MAPAAKAVATQKPHIVLLPSPGMGHLIPLLELAKHFIKRHDTFDVTCIVPTIGPPSAAMKAVLETLPSSINHVFLPPVDMSEIINTESVLSAAISLSLPSLRDVIASLLASGARLVGFLVDPFGFDAFDVAKEFDIPPYLFFPANGMSLSFFIHFQKLDESTTGEFRDMTEPVRIPGSVPIHGSDLLEPVQDRKSKTYKWFLSTTKQIGLARGILVNTFEGFEAGALRAVMEDEQGDRPSIYPIGPLIQRESNDSDHYSLKWLDNQPTGSVLFVSFGSGGTHSQAQINELASGLEMSGQRFIWVVRSPNEESNAGAFFTHQSKQDPIDFLPKGFVERTKDRGLVLPSWAPQAQILSHGSVGGFLTHCGWNSILESVVNGVPMIAWPLYAEQKMNAVMLSEGDVQVALRVKADQNGLVMGKEISKVVIALMEGEEGIKIRNRVKEVQSAGKKALDQDGTSISALEKLAQEWMSN